MSNAAQRGVKWLLGTLTVAISVTSTPLDSRSSDQSFRRGRTLAYACAACHGPEGRSTGAIPSLRAVPADTLRESLRAFRSGGRSGTVMNRLAQGLDDRDIEAVATYFSSVGQR